MSIPKTIHYCWFGRNPLPADAEKCIQSWRKHFPDYEIKEWNESNFDINICDYVREAYEAKKWAFVSDYARFWILYNFGGLYFDTDVEVIKPYDDILAKGAFLGCEPAKGIEMELANGVVVNPGLGMGAYAGMNLYKSVLDYYNSLHFDPYNLITVCRHTTTVLVGMGYRGENDISRVGDINIYPIAYFCPLNYFTGELIIRDTTHSIHHYSETWHTPREIKIRKLQDRLEKKYGHSISSNILFRVYRNLYCYGIKATITKLREKK